MCVFILTNAAKFSGACFPAPHLHRAFLSAAVSGPPLCPLQPTWEDASGTLCPCPRPQAPSVTRAGWVLQGHLLGTEVGGLITKAECGAARGGCLLEGPSLRTFRCLPGSALPPTHPRFTQTFMQAPLWGKAQPFGVTAIALWPFACLGRGASQAQMKEAWKR